MNLGHLPDIFGVENPTPRLMCINAAGVCAKHQNGDRMAARRDSTMMSFTFSIDQVRPAPLEVRRWIEREVTAAVALLQGIEHDPSQLHETALSACTPHEAAEVYELIRGNFLLSQVFFELAREAPRNRGEAPLHALGLADMLRHTRVADGDRLVECFTAINQAFQTIRNDPEASLFGFDQYGHVWIHQTTHESIRELWEQLFHRQQPMAAGPAMAAAGPPLAGFRPPYVGPSEEVAQDRPGSPAANF
jgi:hypothetical protein